MNHTVAVLGLGRMGRALVRRMAAESLSIVSWSRRGTTVDGAIPAATAADAVRGADVVLLALLDAQACADVLDASLGAVPPSGTIVNLATVAPDEAESLAVTVRGAGRRYLHAPVLGSVDAVAAGALTILLGASPSDADTEVSTTRVLASLGWVVPVGDAGTAALLKLIANSVLTTSLVGLGEAVARAERLGLERELTLDVLERTVLGRLTAAKRPWLVGSAPAATFTVGALAKDLRLLAGADPCSRQLARVVSAAGVPSDADVGALSARFGEASSHVVDPLSRLTAARGIELAPEVVEPLIAYARGHATGDPVHFQRGFRSTARISGLREGVFVVWDLTAYCALFSGHPAADEEQRRRTITSLEVHGTVASASMVLEHGADVFSDLFLLVRNGEDWRISDKVYDRVVG
jgi:3-hydroxyisobutyrate dehydrogenase-like beta-hydroxyacid dehydrogenase